MIVLCKTKKTKKPKRGFGERTDVYYHEIADQAAITVREYRQEKVIL